ncbi:diacylglycerol/lipid kinase family protein [Pseudonocardia acidicola]|uniref:diacylglycerol/lipid kinase family protein n=1 Tax=Pseudonocardia acidicola TaxID=2724939 RepID=UPI003083F493
MTTRTQPSRPAEVTPAQRWLARLAFVAAFAAIAVLIAGAGLRSIALVVLGVVGIAVALAATWSFLAHRGALRWLSAVVAVAAPLVVLGLDVWAGLLWVVVASLALAGVAGAAGRAALSRDRPARPGPVEYPAAPVRHPFFVMNPRSGGGKVKTFGLDEKAAALGAEVALLEGPGVVDVVELARDAVARGADLLGVAGGDGTQALVAGVAAEHGVPFVVLSAGTRNHFALDLGLDRDDPPTGLGALTDGVELHVDLGVINDRIFVNNASFGAYAEIVQSPDYRDDKVGTTLQLLPDLLTGHRGPHLTARADGRVTIEAPQAVLVSNNPYGTGDVAGLGRRGRLDQGVLGVVGITVSNAAQAAGLLRRQHTNGLVATTARQVIVDADSAEIPVGIDGESVSLPTPVHCTIRPGALRVRVPRERPGVPVAKPPMNWARLREQALPTAGPAVVHRSTG